MSEIFQFANNPSIEDKHCHAYSALQQNWLTPPPREIGCQICELGIYRYLIAQDHDRQPPEQRYGHGKARLTLDTKEGVWKLYQLSISNIEQIWINPTIDYLSSII